MRRSDCDESSRAVLTSHGITYRTETRKKTIGVRLLQEHIQSLMARFLMRNLAEHTDSILILQKSIRSAVLRKETKEDVSKCSKEKTSQPLMMSVLSPREKGHTVEDDVLFITQMLVNRCLEAEFSVPPSVVKYLSVQGEGALVKSYRKKETSEVVEMIDYTNLYGIYECKKGLEYAIL